MLTSKKFEHLKNITQISQKTIEEHLSLYQGYVNKYNEIEEKIKTLTTEDFEKANQTFSFIRELKVEFSFAYSGVINHELYFENLTNEKTTVSKKLKDQINKDFGSFEKFTQEIKASAMAARGWVYLVWDENIKKLDILIGDAHNSYLIFNMKPLFALDVYEHAYFIDFGAKRAKYLDEIIKLINWNNISLKSEQLF